MTYTDGLIKSEMIVLISMGEVEEATLETLRQPFTEVFGQRTQIGTRLQLLRESWNHHRGQHLATMLLTLIPLPRPEDRALGVADIDILAPGLNFVFGEADITGKRALISLQRLRQEFYGLPQDENLFQERALKEAVQERGQIRLLYFEPHIPPPYLTKTWQKDWK